MDNTRRKEKIGGGVGIYIRNTKYFSTTKLAHMNKSCKDIEIVWTFITNPHQRNMILASVYRPPNGDPETLAIHLTRAVRELYENYRRVDIILLGDFNINYNAKNCPKFDNLKHFKHLSQVLNN